MTDRRPKLSAHERLRLAELHGWTCHICGGRIDPKREAWDIEHVVSGARIGWAAAETDDNRRPAHRRVCHPRKTAQDLKAIAKLKRQRLKFGFGIFRESGRPIPGSRNTPFKVRLTSRGPRTERRPS